MVSGTPLAIRVTSDTMSYNTSGSASTRTRASPVVPLFIRQVSLVDLRGAMGHATNFVCRRSSFGPSTPHIRITLCMMRSSAERLTVGSGHHPQHLPEQPAPGLRQLADGVADRRLERPGLRLRHRVHLHHQHRVGLRGTASATSAAEQTHLPGPPASAGGPFVCLGESSTNAPVLECAAQAVQFWTACTRSSGAASATGDGGSLDHRCNRRSSADGRLWVSARRRLAASVVVTVVVALGLGLSRPGRSPC